jgi:hypothetical protein
MHQTATTQEMTVSTPPTSPHATGNLPDVLRHILKPSVNLCQWQRPAQQAVAQELSSLQAPDLPDVRCTTLLDSLDDDVCKLLQHQGLDPLAFVNWRKD